MIPSNVTPGISEHNLLASFIFFVCLSWLTDAARELVCNVYTEDVEFRAGRTYALEYKLSAAGWLTQAES